MVLRAATYDDIPTLLTLIHTAFEEYRGRLSVLPAFRQHGVGLALVTYVEQQAKALGAQRVQLGVRIALPYLQAYYERLGYRVVCYETHEGYTEPTSVVMEKQVL